MFGSNKQIESQLERDLSARLQEANQTIDELDKRKIKLTGAEARHALAKSIFLQWTGRPEFLDRVAPEDMARDAVALADALLERLK